MSHSRTLYNAVKAQQGHISFHTPGHKFRCEETVSAAIADTTEISSTDELYHPFGPILTAEDEAAQVFGAKTLCFSAGGATLCLQTALSFYSGKKVLAERSCHISVINASALLNIDLHFVWGETHPEMGFAMPATPLQIENELKQGDFAALVMTSPNYYGLCANLESIRQVCDRFGVDLIIDNSHGSHLSVMYPNDGYRDAIKYGHFTVNSLHKTLPVMTGGAALCVNKDIPSSKVKQHMSLFGSTSPSFAILASIDYGIWYFSENVKNYIDTASRVSDLKNKIEDLGFGVLRSNAEEPLRICVNTFPKGYTAKETEEVLNANGIFSEIAIDRTLVLLFSPFNSVTDEEKLLSVLSSMDSREPLESKLTISLPIPRKVLSLKEAILSPTEYVPSEETAGRISAETFATCPPGMAIVVSGEEITEEASALLSKHKQYTEVIK